MTDRTEGMSTADPDAELVRVAQRELPYRTQAFEMLMRRHQSVLYQVCLRLLGNVADAQDVSQEVMVKAFGALPRFEGRAQFRTWLMRIATNTCHSMRHRLHRQRDMVRMLSESHRSEGGAALWQAHKADQQIDTQALLSMLPEEDQTLLTLRYVADLKFEEIAEISGLKLSAAKMRVYRAAEKLRELAGEAT